MTAENNLSPWAHPKAKAWYRALIRRTNFPRAIEDQLRVPADQLSLEIVRMAIAFAVLLAKQETWPEEDRDVLKLILDKAKAYTTQPIQSGGKPVSLAQHQAHAKVVAELNHEIELVRRRLGVSARKSKMGPPVSWEPFWE